MEKTKEGKYCPFRTGHFCSSFCGLYCINLKACVFHGINANLAALTRFEGKKTAVALEGN